VGSLYRSKGERKAAAEYSTARFTIDEAAMSLAAAS
jgi:hypothetical protein